MIGPASPGPLHFQVTAGLTQPLYVTVAGVGLPVGLDLYGEARLAYDVGEHFGFYGGARYSRAGEIADWSGVFLGIQVMTGSGGGGDEKDDEEDDDVSTRARRLLDEGK